MNEIIIQIIGSFLTGMTLGAVFTVFKLPIPAPISISGVIGILGIWIGYNLINLL